MNQTSQNLLETQMTGMPSSKMEMECQLPNNMRTYQNMYVSPAMIRANKAAGKLDELLHPFDEIDVPLVTGGTVTVVCGYATASHARLVFKDCWDKAVMNFENLNTAGYYMSDAREHVLEEIYPCISPEWRKIIVPRTIVEILGGEQVEYADPLWIPSATDVYGPRSVCWNDKGDNFQLPIFRRERDRVKELGDKGTYLCWLRSVDINTTYYFWRICSDGTPVLGLPSSISGIAPGFDI